MQASGEHKQRIQVQIAVNGIKIRNKKFHWLISVQVRGERMQQIRVQIAMDSIKISDKKLID